MQPPLEAERSHEAKESSNYQQRFAEIIGRELDARTIDTYADDALNDLVALVEEVTVEYPSDDRQITGVEREQYALEQAELDDDAVETALDHINEIAHSIERLDALIAKKRRLVSTVIVPPELAEGTEIKPRDGSFEKVKERIPKLKTLLLLLEKSFDINIEDDEQVTITSGALRPHMMRQVSYDVVAVPRLGRVVLVCDEAGNTTFMFDTGVCDEYGITPEYLSELSKAELKDLIHGDASLGGVIDYSKEYADHLLRGLTQAFDHDNNERNEDDASKTPNAKLLQPRAELAPEGVVTRSDFCKKYHFQSPDVNTWINAVFGSIDVLPVYKFVSRDGENSFIRTGLTVDTQKKLLSYAQEELGIVMYRPEGYLSAKGIAISTGVNREAVQTVVDDLTREGKLEPIQEYRFGSIATRGYSPADTKLILERMQQRELMAPLPPADYLSSRAMGEKFGVAGVTIRKAAAVIGDSVGKVDRYRYGPHVTEMYSPEQQRMILEYLQNRPRVKLGEVALSFLAGGESGTVD